MNGKNYIDGEWLDASNGQTFANINPANLQEELGQFAQSTETDVTQAIQAADRAFATWKRMPPADRADLLEKALHLMDARCDQIARELTLENGKTLAESKAEIIAARREMAYQINQGLQLCGQTKRSAKDGVLCISQREPLGVVAIVTPWNFPFNVVCRKSIPALMAGNCVVFKPASFTPAVGVLFTKIMHDAGIPAGVFNLVTGRGALVGDQLIQHPAIKAVSFTGSTEIGKSIERKALDHGCKTQAEMGGKNPTVVLADANLSEAADAIVLAAYACAGQWCTSTSRAILLDPIADKMTELIVERAKQIVVGNGLDAKTNMGPVAGESQLKTVLDYIQIGRNEGARLLLGGNRCEAEPLAQGTFIEPTIFTDVQPTMRIAREEIFGPVLSIMRVKDFDEAIALANDVEFGLSSSVFTNDLSKAMSFVEQTAVGLTHVNMPTAYKEVTLEFGGIKDSGAGPPEAGAAGIEFFTEHKVAYIRYR